MNPSLLLLAQNLRVARGDRCLLDGFALSVQAGDVVQLLGRNGAGKTSLLEVLAGIRRAESGQVQCHAAVHWLGHRNGLNPALSVQQNLDFWALAEGGSPASVAAALQVLKLRALAARPVRMLSTGQKRRVGIARLLLQPRPLWLLDEPFAGLDTASQALVGGLLCQHLQTGGAVLLTSHQSLPPGLPAVRPVLL